MRWEEIARFWIQKLLTQVRTALAGQVTAARLAGADAILTNDRRWAGRVLAPMVVVLEDYVG